MDKDWTIELVQARLERAAWVFRCLPAVRPQGFFNAWPEYFHSFADKVGQEPQPMKVRPGPRDITEAEEALLWLRWLEVEDAKLVWARVDGARWKAVCWQFGISRAAAHRRWQYGLALIVWRLHGRTPSAKRSQRFVVENADRLSREIIL